MNMNVSAMFSGSLGSPSEGNSSAYAIMQKPHMQVCFVLSAKVVSLIRNLRIIYGGRDWIKLPNIELHNLLYSINIIRERKSM
jgi:hypothetical protein